MGLQDVDVKDEYRSLIDNIAKDFYIPLLQQATVYNRAVGFFSSSILVEISKGISGLVRNGGRIKLVASPYLSDDDVTAIRFGYKQRDEIIKNAIKRELHEPQSDLESERLNLLANLISQGVLDIKIAFTEKNEKLGMFHEKMGIIADEQGNKVAFSGSMNESSTALTLNYEAIDVFCSWKGEIDRIKAKENAFISIWNDREPNIQIINFPELDDEIIKKYKRGTPDFNIDEKEECKVTRFDVEKSNVQTFFPENPNGFEFYNYQVEAINSWEKNNYRGIFDMATGTGKTYTGLGAVTRLSKAKNNELAVIIVCPYQHLVEQWVEDIIKFNIAPIIGYSASSQKDWKNMLDRAIRDQKLRVKGKTFFCFICTNATFASEYVKTKISRIRAETLFVVDEAHNFGAEYLNQLLSENFTYRLALSATLERHNDEEGTQKLFDFFGEKCIEYDLERAIDEEKLTKYKYYPVVVSLTEAEFAEFAQLTREISKCVIKGKSGRTKLNDRGKRLALKRSRLVAAASNKVSVLREVILKYQNRDHLLVYCGAASVHDYENNDVSTVDSDDLRQIDIITDMLGNELDMKVSQFTSKEDIQERKLLKKEFAKGDNLQALIAIKCLDEGVNIPCIDTAFILASTTNPKEYIQRRGRVLRLYPGKEFAEIYDFITLPRELSDVSSLTADEKSKELSLVRNELSRAAEFTRLADNFVEANEILEDIRELYGITEDISEITEDYYDE